MLTFLNMRSDPSTPNPAEQVIQRVLSHDALDTPPNLVEAHFAWARKRGHPNYLWPDVPIHSWRAGLLEIERITTKLLSGNSLPVRLEAPRDGGPKTLGIAAFTSGMGPLLGFWLESGALETLPEVAAILRLHLDHGRQRAARLESEFVRALDVLDSAGITATVIKGLHTARGYFPDPGTRPCVDIDLVISPENINAASRAMSAAGYVAVTRQSRPYKCDWFPAGAQRKLRSIELTHADNPWAVEIHASLDRTFYGVRTVSLGPLDTHRTAEWEQVHDSAKVLSQPLLLAFLALHASEELHHVQLVRLVELVLVIREDLATGRLSWDEVTSLLERASAMRFAYPALELAERLAPGTLDGELRGRLARAATPRMRRVVDRLRPATAQRLDKLSLEERFMWAERPIEYLRRMAYLLWPTAVDKSDYDLKSIYRQRFYRLLRGRVSVHAPQDGE